VDTVHERETIVMAHGADGRWLGVHEHLSPQPEAV
jgi:ketosteroid isomerase-like protein